MKIFNTLRLKMQVNDLLDKELELVTKLEKAEKRIKELEGNQEFLIQENTTLKQINKKRYLKYEDKMKFLEEREKYLTKIQEMINNNVRWNEIKKYIKSL